MKLQGGYLIKSNKSSGGKEKNTESHFPYFRPTGQTEPCEMEHILHSGFCFLYVYVNNLNYFKCIKSKFQY